MCFLFDLLVNLTPIHEIPARLLGTNMVYLGFSLPLWSFFVFRKKAAADLSFLAARRFSI